MVTIVQRDLGHNMVMMTCLCIFIEIKQVFFKTVIMTD